MTQADRQLFDVRNDPEYIELSGLLKQHSLAEAIQHILNTEQDLARARRRIEILIEISEETKPFSINIDQDRRREQVSEVTDSGFFRNLRDQLGKLREENAQAGTQLR